MDTTAPEDTLATDADGDGRAAVAHGGEGCDAGLDGDWGTQRWVWSLGGTSHVRFGAP